MRPMESCGGLVHVWLSHWNSVFSLILDLSKLVDTLTASSDRLRSSPDSELAPPDRMAQAVIWVVVEMRELVSLALGDG